MTRLKKKFIRPANEAGFSLMELLVVVTIIGILASIAMPAYNEYVSRARRASGKAGLNHLSQFLERYYTQNGRYRDSLGNYPALVPDSEAAKYYTFTLDTATVNSDTEYKLKATRNGAQSNDRCGDLTLTHAGVKGIENESTGETVSTCW